MSDRLRIAQVAPPFERVPPDAYGGTERIVHGLVTELDRRGHEVTTFASGDSVVPGRHIETVRKALRRSAIRVTRCPTCSSRCNRCSPTPTSSI